MNMPGSSEINITYRLAFNDMAFATRAMGEGSWWWSSRTQAATGVLILAAAWLLLPYRQGYLLQNVLGTLVVGLGFGLVMMSLLAFVNPYLVFLTTPRPLRDPSRAVEMHVTISDEGFALTKSGERYVNPWSDCERVFETRRAFLLAKKKSVWAVIPKRAFSPQQEQSFRDLARRNVPSGIRRR